MPESTLGIMFRCQYPPELLRRSVQLAEENGFDEFWLVEDCFWGGGIASTTAALASTQRIAVGLGILPAVVRNAAFVAMELATLARLYPNRILPGFGHGVGAWMRQVGAFPPSQLAALEETTTAVRALLRGERYSVDGRTVRLQDVQLDLPPEHVPPVVLGVRGPKSLQLSGRVADGTILAEGASPAYVRWAREQIALGATEMGSVAHHRVTVYLWASIGEDGAAARMRLRPLVAQALTSAEGGAYVEPLDIADDVRALASRGAEAFAANMPDEWLDLFAVCGTPEQGAATLERFYAAGADTVVLVPFTDRDPLEQIEGLARALLPLRRAAP